MRKDKIYAAQLRRDFGSVSIEPVAKGVYKASIPNLFFMRDVSAGLAGLFSSKVKILLEQPCGIALDERHCLRTLYANIEKYGAENLYAHLPKLDQDPLALRHGEQYERIHNTHPHHSHSDPGLYDFVRLKREGGSLVKEAFDMRHFHLRNLSR
ncbi:MAG: hypothetical protein DI586_03865 [Micavibrio aeruginosavorus]|uniref:Uncharacterized protein n=1 Tax=Micavibrio aeruginosavorus TaxID=349221 RepID=A0A2W5HRT7_9BACT|nr:MAG: hypothetical protein DI586_03865 [Micavibrio aeruginosavorus]